mmetsp:Transcript_28/g.98  ORF Transcript_28/g.98 Transcript_28/m.98 type:complete len:231 (+) Transcript_28:805-1497(+)
MVTEILGPITCEPSHRLKIRRRVQSLPFWEQLKTLRQMPQPAQSSKRVRTFPCVPKMLLLPSAASQPTHRKKDTSSPPTMYTDRRLRHALIPRMCQKSPSMSTGTFAYSPSRRTPPSVCACTVMGEPAVPDSEAGGTIMESAPTYVPFTRHSTDPGEATFQKSEMRKGAVAAAPVPPPLGDAKWVQGGVGGRTGGATVGGATDGTGVTTGPAIVVELVPFWVGIGTGVGG